MAKHECLVHAAEVNGFKRFLVGIAVILTTALLTEAGALIWWCSSMNTKVGYVERDVVKVVADVAVIASECCP